MVQTWQLKTRFRRRLQKHMILQHSHRSDVQKQRQKLRLQQLQLLAVVRQRQPDLRRRMRNPQATRAADWEMADLETMTQVTMRKADRKHIVRGSRTQALAARRRQTGHALT